MYLIIFFLKKLIVVPLTNFHKSSGNVAKQYFFKLWQVRGKFVIYLKISDKICLNTTVHSLC